MIRSNWLPLAITLTAAAVIAVLLLGRAELPRPGTLPPDAAQAPADDRADASTDIPLDTSAVDPAAPTVDDELVLRYPRLRIPVAGVRRAELVDTYRQARSEGRTHDAIDILAPRGTPVVAAADGTVLKLFESDAGGTTLYQLDPDGRIIYYYAHLEAYAPGIREGREVERGDTIAYVGDSGNAQPGDAHLHFEVLTTDDPEQWWGGRPTNPYPLLVDAGELR